MKKKLVKLTKNNRGQGVMEYLIITSLVGIICLVTVKQFGSAIETRIKQMKRKITSEIRISVKR